MRKLDCEFGQKLKHVAYKDREAVYGLLFKQDKILIIKTPRGYFLPGGGVEQGETDEESLLREFIEETGLQIRIEDYLGRSVLYDKSPKDQIHYNMYGNFYMVKEIGSKKKTETDHKPLYMTIDEAIEHLQLVHQVWALKLLKNKKSL